MCSLTLVIGNKNYSSWSLRPWLALRHAGIPFTERLIPLSDENWDEAITGVSPSRRVPVLLHGEGTIGESLAILEYVHELFPDAGLRRMARRGASRALGPGRRGGRVNMQESSACRIEA